MRRTTKYIALWFGATALTVGLSWLSVRGVLHTAVFEQPTAVFATPPTGSPAVPPVGAGQDASGFGGSPGRSPSGSPNAGQGPRGDSTSRASATQPGPSVPPTPRSTIRSVDVRGGRAVFSVTEDSAKLVSAVPESGYRTEVSRNIGWLRVDFISSERWSSVVASWYQHAPTIEVYEQRA